MPTWIPDDGLLVFPAMPSTHYFHFGIGLGPALYAVPFNVLGLPSLSVPMGRDPQGYPRAVQLVAHPDNEFEMLAMARRLARQFGGAVLPQYTEGKQ